MSLSFAIYMTDGVTQEMFTVKSIYSKIKLFNCPACLRRSIDEEKEKVEMVRGVI